ncbi:MAG: twin-arginine translocase TatA/TatE family subunit [Bacteroidetes bacterium]|jgi:sec-independent protein translocase protein TatA|nr:twin-arginine translocase TatA/TatE family subunit [Bacteroidota bacterium]
MFGNIGGSELFLILLIILVFFGAKKLPDLAKGLGQGIREFRKAARDVQEEVEKETRQLDLKNDQSPPSDKKA